MNQKLAELIADVLDMPVAEVTPRMVREGHPKWDSLNHLRLVTAIEEEFGVALSMDEIEAVETVGQLDEMIAEHCTPA
ncbi:acyl carrier protein [Geminicoccaceae bacterium 1502E]|nr:acyl carrier protein [Geminicoccaceae bacterium 1502E]